MSDAESNDGSTNITEEQRRRTDSLGDGTSSGSDAASDTASGGEPDEPDTTDDDGTPGENPSG